MSIDLAVVGAAGRMGKRIVALAVESGTFRIVGAVDNADHPDAGKDAGAVAGIEPLGVKVGSEFPGKADVVIDFSLPQATDKTLAWCGQTAVPLVIGTTGLSGDQKASIEALSKKSAVVFASNMSVGMNVLFSLVGEAAKMLGEAYDIEIVEHHHRFKKDAPSGSAMTLAEKICQATAKDPKESLVHGRQGEAPRRPGDIGMHAVRAGDIVGVHSVIFSTLGETITLKHTAHSRDTFVRGAIKAAEWVAGKAPALYSMSDVLAIQ